ncbi:MAG: GFA family protein [Alphaproteobacteria bacterium]
MKIDGGCHCGNISYAAEIDPDKVFLCHCEDCQQLSGTAFRTVVPLPEADFELLSGTLKIYVKTAESGNKREQAFCPECGSPIYATSVGGASRKLGLRVGTARQRNELPPKAHSWARHAQPWLSTLDGLPKTDGQK